jgi:hypothetical protein
MQRLVIDRFRAPATCRPFCNDPQRTSGALALEAAPQFGTVATTSQPLRVEPLQMVFEGAFTDTEDVGSLTSQDPADQAAAMSAEPDDLLDGCAGRGQLQDCRIGVLPPEIAFVLEALGSG